MKKKKNKKNKKNDNKNKKKIWYTQLYTVYKRGVMLMFSFWISPISTIVVLFSFILFLISQVNTNKNIHII